jgi:hypothetical protein
MRLISALPGSLSRGRLRDQPDALDVHPAHQTRRHYSVVCVSRQAENPAMTLISWNLLYDWALLLMRPVPMLVQIGRQLHNDDLLSGNEVVHQHDGPIGKFKRIMMLV